MRIRTVLIAGLVLAAAATSIILTHSPSVVGATNDAAPETTVYSDTEAANVCQADETLPAGITAIRLWLNTAIGPRVTVSVLRGTHLITHGTQAAGWYGTTVTVPVRPLSRTYTHVRVCLHISDVNGYVQAVGTETNVSSVATVDGRALSGRISIAYLRPSRRSWWARAHTVIRNMGLGRAPSGRGVVYLILALMVATVALACRMLVRIETPRERTRSDGEASAGRGWRALPRRVAGGVGRVPPTAAACALIACVNAACWSLITPAFQVTDEPSHFAYVQYLAETGRFPSAGGNFGPAQEIAMQDVEQQQVHYSPQNHTISTQAQQDRLERDLALPLSRMGPDAGVAASEPPLYYALETIPYFAGTSGTVLDRLTLMRLFSALFAGITVFFVVLFLRESLSRVPWAWTIGGLGVAFLPLLGMMSGAVNPDAMLYAVSASLFYVLARGFRRGLTPRLAIAIALVVVAGLMTKLNFLGLVPGAALGVVVLTVRARRASPRAALRALAAIFAVAAGPVCLYVLISAISGRRPFDGFTSHVVSAIGGGSLVRESSYIWQFYLPRLPGMRDYFPGLNTTRQFWVNGFVGLYGWLDTVFPAWVYDLAVFPLGGICILLARALVVDRACLRRRVSEFAVYGAIAVGLMLLVGASDYSWFPRVTGDFAQARYLLPIVALYGAGLTLAARGAGQRWGPVVGASIVVLLIAHDLFSQLLEVSRFYG